VMNACLLADRSGCTTRNLACENLSPFPRNLSLKVVHVAASQEAGNDSWALYGAHLSGQSWK